jgi:P-type Cu2+ transporter
VPGQGIEAILGKRRMRIGTPDFVAALHGKALPTELSFTTEEVTVIALGDQEGWVALFTFAETLCPHARAIVSALRARGRTVAVLSGDRAARTEHVARCVGADLARGDAQPHEKVEYVRALQRDGAVVAMIGDGVNDAPVLAQAQVSVAMGTGTELARISADVVLTGSDLRPLAGAVKAAADTMRVIRQNIGWAMLYNVIAVPLAAAGQLSPLSAAVGMSLSSLAVVLNALRLARAVPALPSGARASGADRASPGWNAPARSST